MKVLIANSDSITADGEWLEKSFSVCDIDSAGEYVVIDAECVEVCVCTNPTLAELVVKALNNLVTEDAA